MIVTCFESDAPSLSVTVAVMVWIPTERVTNEKKLSVAKNPSLLEVHCMELLSEPSSSSVAVPENITESPCVDSEPEDGDVMDTVGG